MIIISILKIRFGVYITQKTGQITWFMIKHYIINSHSFEEHFISC